MKTAIALLVLLAIVGCRPVARSAAPAAKAKAPVKSASQTLIDGFTGRTAVEAGKRAETKIRQISAERDRDLDQALKQ
jgi:hypothetical protein